VRRPRFACASAAEDEEEAAVERDGGGDSVEREGLGDLAELVHHAAEPDGAVVGVDREGLRGVEAGGAEDAAGRERGGAVGLAEEDRIVDRRAGDDAGPAALDGARLEDLGAACGDAIEARVRHRPSGGEGGDERGRETHWKRDAEGRVRPCRERGADGDEGVGGGRGDVVEPRLVARSEEVRRVDIGPAQPRNEGIGDGGQRAVRHASEGDRAAHVAGDEEVGAHCGDRVGAKAAGAGEAECDGEAGAERGQLGDEDACLNRRWQGAATDRQVANVGADDGERAIGGDGDVGG